MTPGASFCIRAPDDSTGTIWSGYGPGRRLGYVGMLHAFPKRADMLHVRSIAVCGLKIKVMFEFATIAKVILQLQQPFLKRTIATQQNGSEELEAAHI